MKRTCNLFVSTLGALLVFSGTGWGQTANVAEVAKTMVRALGEENCRLLFEDRDDDAFAPEIYSFQHRDDGDDAPLAYQLVRVPCWLGAYNQGDAYVLFDPYDTARLMSFAVPQYDVSYKDPETQEHVQSVQITGYTSRETVVLSHFDVKTRQISEYYKSRGIGDAGTSAIWRFKDGSFGLLRFELDASFDGEINPQTLVDFGRPK